MIHVCDHMIKVCDHVINVCDYMIYVCNDHMIYCLQERMRSMQCLSDNNYDYSKCQEFFDDFKKCKKEWVSDYIIDHYIMIMFDDCDNHWVNVVG